MRWLPLSIIVAMLCCVVAAQKPGNGPPRRGASQEDLSLDRERMLRERDQQSVREGKLIHLLIRHGLGLQIDAAEYLSLSKRESAMPESAVRAQLRAVQAELAVKAAALEKAGGADPADPAAENVPSGEPAATGPAAAGAATEVAAGSRGNRAKPVASYPKPRSDDQSRNPGSGRGATAGGKRPVQAVISGSSSPSVVGRILFKAGQYEKALEVLAPLEKDKSAKLADLFYLARCNEELHTRALALAASARARAASAQAAAVTAGAAADKLAEARRSDRSVGGSASSKAEFDQLRERQAASAAEFEAQSKLASSRAREAAQFYDDAYNILILIEGRDTVRDRDGVDVPGRWAEAARSARKLLTWLATKKEWSPPAIQWQQK